MHLPSLIDWRSFIIIAVCGLTTWTGPAIAEGRTAKEILSDLDGIAIPGLDPVARKDKKVVAEYSLRVEGLQQERSSLIRELCTVDPDNDRLPSLLAETWAYRISKTLDERNASLRELIKAGADRKRLLDHAHRPWFQKLTDEIDGVIAKTHSAVLKTEGEYWKAKIVVQSFVVPDDPVPAIEGFIHMAPKDPRGAELLYIAAMRIGSDQVRQEGLLARLLAEYPDGDYVTEAEGMLARLAGVGRPFEFAFTDAITGRPVSSKELLGKVVVLDVWATWCGPCVEAMPALKTLYERYHEHGVEFIGVSQDRPYEDGLKKLKAFVEKHEIGWPQHYVADGTGHMPSILRGAGGRLPTVFVVDQEGKLFSAHGRGKLDTIIPELLAKPRERSKQ